MKLTSSMETESRRVCNRGIFDQIDGTQSLSRRTAQIARFCTQAILAPLCSQMSYPKVLVFLDGVQATEKEINIGLGLGLDLFGLKFQLCPRLRWLFNGGRSQAPLLLDLDRMMREEGCRASGSESLPWGSHAFGSCNFSASANWRHRRWLFGTVFGSNRSPKPLCSPRVAACHPTARSR